MLISDAVIDAQKFSQSIGDDADLLLNFAVKNISLLTSKKKLSRSNTGEIEAWRMIGRLACGENGDYLTTAIVTSVDEPKISAVENKNLPVFDNPEVIKTNISKLWSLYSIYIGTKAHGVLSVFEEVCNGLDFQENIPLPVFKPTKIGDLTL